MAPFFLPLAQSTHLFLHTCVLSHTPTDCVARIFSLTPFLRPGIKLTAVQLNPFEGLYLGTLNRLSCLSPSNSWLLEIEVLSANFRTRVRARARRSLRRSTPTQRTSGRRWLTGSPRGEPSTRRTGTPINCGHRWSAS